MHPASDRVSIYERERESFCCLFLLLQQVDEQVAVYNFISQGFINSPGLFSYSRLTGGKKKKKKKKKAQKNMVQQVGKKKTSN